MSVGIVPLFSIETFRQQHLGQSIIAVEVTLKKASATVGVTMAVLVGKASPSIAMAIDNAAGVSPSGTDILPLYVT